jgi:hypothetical protein
MGVLALGGVLATNATLLMGVSTGFGVALAVLAFALIGAGVAASGTSLLALLATRVAAERRPAAAAITWIMMIVGFIVTTAVAGSLLDPYSAQRLATVAGGVALCAFLLATVAVMGIEGEAEPAVNEARPAFREVLAEVWAEPDARRFTLFVGLAMVAYSVQELILEPFAGLVFGFTVGESTRLASVQNQGRTARHDHGRRRRDGAGPAASGLAARLDDRRLHRFGVGALRACRSRRGRAGLAAAGQRIPAGLGQRGFRRRGDRLDDGARRRGRPRPRRRPHGALGRLAGHRHGLRRVPRRRRGRSRSTSLRLGPGRLRHGVRARGRPLHCRRADGGAIVVPRAGSVGRAPESFPGDLNPLPARG